MSEEIIQKKRMDCIACGSPLADDIVIIGDQYPSAIFVSDKSDVMDKLEASSLNLTRCTNEDCSLVQLANIYDLQYVFDHYPYESNSTATMKQILQDVVDDAREIVPLTSDDVVLDIGGNDGTMLGLISEPVRARVNIDAAAGVKQSVVSENYKHIHARFNAKVYQELDLPKPRLIFSVAMFYHLNDPLDFCRNISEIMSDDSVWVLQMTYLGTMLRDNIFDNIVHEHAAYYSLFSLEALLAQVGLQIAEARLVESYGGSLRVFIVKNQKGFPKKDWRKDYASIQQFELENRTNTFEALYAFNSRTQLLRDSIGAIVDFLVQKHGPLWGFGASTKGNMILQYLGIKTDRMSCILDNSPKKIGTWTTGSMIPIVEEEASLKSLPEYLFVLPYYYTKAFVKIIQKRLTVGQQVYLFVPLPHPHFIKVSHKGGIMINKLGNIDILQASCNISTVQDGRGAIFTWIPDQPIVEFNMLYFHPNKIRGNHFHPEFVEYFLIVEGTVVMVTKDPETGKEVNMHASRGTCFRTPPNTSHAVHAITQSICISCLTKPWDNCEKPIVYEDLVGFDPDYIAHMKSKDPNYNPADNTGKSKDKS